MVMISVENLDETIRKAWKYSNDFHEAAKKHTKDSAGVVRKQMRADAPVGKKGNLKKSIKAKYFWKEGPASTVYPRGLAGSHRHLVRYGTSVRRHKSGKSVGKMTANDFTSNAERKGDAHYNALMLAEVNKDVII